MTDKRLRVLICEDDERLAMLVTETLASDGRFEVVARATNGDDAIRLAAEHAPDVVLMDIGMPGIDGIDATRAIRARDAAQHVVIYTGSDEYDDIGRADAAGAAGFLHKEALTSPNLPDALQVLHTNFVRARPDPD
jgi:two-component system, NarL family, nitrate/nitrite response regulator NarP